MVGSSPSEGTHRPCCKLSAREERCTTFECGMSPGWVTLARLPLKGAGSSQSGAVSSLIFRSSTGKEIFGCTFNANNSSQHTIATANDVFLSSAPVCISTSHEVARKDMLSLKL